MNEICRLLWRSIELYAEDELHDPRKRLRVCRHLDGCAACRSRLGHSIGQRTAAGDCRRDHT